MIEKELTIIDENNIDVRYVMNPQLIRNITITEYHNGGCTLNLNFIRGNSFDITKLSKEKAKEIRSKLIDIINHKIDDELIIIERDTVSGS